MEEEEEDMSSEGAAATSELPDCRHLRAATTSPPAGSCGGEGDVDTSEPPGHYHLLP